jgi:hypothetical protein
MQRSPSGSLAQIYHQYPPNLLKIGRYDIIDDGTAISSSKEQLRGSLENVQTCPVEVSMGL